MEAGLEQQLPRYHLGSTLESERHNVQALGKRGGTAFTAMWEQVPLNWKVTYILSMVRGELLLEFGSPVSVAVCRPRVTGDMQSSSA